MTLGELSAKTGVPPSTLRRWAKKYSAGDRCIPNVFVPRGRTHHRVPISAKLEAWIKKWRNPAPPVGGRSALHLPAGGGEPVGGMVGSRIQHQKPGALNADRRTMVHVLSLPNLPMDAAEMLDSGHLAESTAFLIARIPRPETRIEACREILHPELEEGPLSPRSAELLLAAKYCRDLRCAPFNDKDAQLVPAAGACGSCRWQAGNNPQLYGDVANPNTCMQPECFAAKAAAARAVTVAKLQKEGIIVLSEEENERIFPYGGPGLNFKSDFVEYRKPVPSDLLKREIINPPKWTDLVGPKAQAKVYAGFDQAGRPVELVRVAEAVLAADLNGSTIFNWKTLHQYQATHGIKVESRRRRHARALFPKTSVPPAPSQS